jgi:dCMP deaminase
METTTSTVEWDLRWMDLAREIATWSRDASTKVGCVIVGTSNQILSSGYNGFPRGVFDRYERYERPAKYLWTEHGERNAIYNAAREGVSLKGSTLYVTCVPIKLFPCADCMRGAIQSGVTRVVCDSLDYDHPKWGESNRAACAMLEEAGVDVCVYSCAIRRVKNS